MTVKIEVKQDGITYDDLTSKYDALSLIEGGKSHNPDRPTMQTATGILVLRIVSTDINKKYDCRISVNNVEYWVGTIKFVNQSHEEPKQSTWRLEGAYTDLIQENVGISENASTVANILDGLSPAILDAVEQVQLDVRDTLAINFEGSKGELISRLANVASAIPFERPRTTVKFVSINAIQPDNIAVINSAITKIRKSVNDIPQTDSVRNKATIPLPDIPGITETRTQEATISIASPTLPDGSTQQSNGAYAGGTFSNNLPLPEGVIEDLEVEAIGGIEYAKIARGNTQRFNYYFIPQQPVAWQAYVREGVSLAIFPMTSVEKNENNAEVTVTVPDISATPYRQYTTYSDYQTTRTTRVLGYSSTAFADVVNERYGSNSPAYRLAIASQYGLKVLVRISYTLTTPDVPQPPRVVINENSIQRWGVKELKIDNWLSSNTDLSTFIEKIASLRSIYNIDIPAENVTVDNGDYALIHLATKPRIDSFVLIIGKHLTATPRTKTFVRLTCLELGKVPTPT